MKDIIEDTHICLAGDGRLANQLETVLSAAALPFFQVSRSKNTNSEIQASIKKSTHVWLAISDNAIESFYKTFVSSDSESKTWVHFSGAHSSEFIFSAHPLMSFSKTPMPVDDFNKVHFVISPPEKMSGPKDLQLSHLTPGLKNPFSYIDPKKKAFYHALCVTAGNFPIILWSQVQESFKKLNLPDEALNLYLDQIVKNFKREGSNALTGPLVRNDIQTMKNNLDALEESSLKSIYKAFVESKGIKL